MIRGVYWSAERWLVVLGSDQNTRPVEDVGGGTTVSTEVYHGPVDGVDGGTRV